VVSPGARRDTVLAFGRASARCIESSSNPQISTARMPSAYLDAGPQEAPAPPARGIDRLDQLRSSLRRYQPEQDCQDPNALGFVLDNPLTRCYQVSMTEPTVAARAEALRLISTFYELPGQEVRDAAKQCGIDPDGPAFDLALDVFEHILKNNQIVRSSRPGEYHAQICIRAATLLEAGWTPAKGSES
jgi:hypothetical protein